MNETTPVRAGENIDIETLRIYLTHSADLSDGPIVIEQFPGGSSNLTYLIQTQDAEYVLRRPPFGNTVKTAHDMRREFDVLSKLSAVYKPAPRPLLFCDDETIIGSEFYLMERRRGLIIRGSISSPPVGSPHVSKGSCQPPINAAENELHKFENSQGHHAQVCRSFIQNLADLHDLDFTAAGLGDLGRPEGYPRRQVEGWTKRYFSAKTHEHPELESAIEWLNANIPTRSGASLVHNDYKFDNIMLDPEDLTCITAVLDWEMVTIGDPLMDLGTTLGYWMSADAGEKMMRMPFNPYVLMKNVSRRQLVGMYAEASGRKVSNILFYYVFGTFKIAVIAQQIYARFTRGSTNDQRFAHFDTFVGKLGEIAVRALDSDCI
jgi:aminoglycoside phosphotransferase (APT) family kinase protein